MFLRKKMFFAVAISCFSIFMAYSFAFAQEGNVSASQPQPGNMLLPGTTVPAVAQAVTNAMAPDVTVANVTAVPEVPPVPATPMVAPIPQGGTLETAAPVAAAPIPQGGTLETAAPEAALAPVAAVPDVAKPEDAKPTEWIWGEVASVDTQAKEVVLKHLDYETYEEVQTVLKVSDKTLFENVVSLGEIKAGDHLTADFKISDGSNIADLVVVEKEIVPTEEAGTQALPVLEQTAAEPAANNL